MRLVIDTNCLMVSIPKLSKTRWLFDCMRSGVFDFGITTDILEEYEEVIGNFYSPSLARNVADMLPNLKNSLWVTPYYFWDLITVDRDDNKFVDCAIACQADYIITHDRHFNVLKKRTFPIVKCIKMGELEKVLFPKTTFS